MTFVRHQLDIGKSVIDLIKTCASFLSSRSFTQNQLKQKKNETHIKVLTSVLSSKCIQYVH